MATQGKVTSKTSTPPAPVEAKEPKERKPRNRRTDEATLLERYPHMVAGSLQFETDGPHANKQTALIKCTEPGCKVQRRVATSDLFQIKMCEEHAKAARKANKPPKAEKAPKAEAAAPAVAPKPRVMIRKSA